MTALRRAGLGLLTVLLLAVAAGAFGYATRQPTGPDLDLGRAAAVTTPSPEPTREPGTTTTPTQPPTPTPTSVPTTAPAPATRHNPVRELEPGEPILQRGDTGMRVRDLQARLRALAWYFRTPDGRYGAETEKAVRGFQRKRGFPVTGAVDRRTLTRLHEMTGTPTRDEMGLHNVPGPLDPRCRSGRVLCVDKTSRTLRWVVDGRVLRTVDVRFGSAYTPTREGEFEVYLKSRDHVSSLYDTPMPFAMFFSGGQAVHYSPDFAATGYDGASHGCVNVRDHAAIAWLYDQVDIGDDVVVYRS